jgi:Ion channel
MKRAITNFLKRYRSELLTLAFVLQMIISPLADRNPHLGALLAIALFLMILVSGSYMVDRRIVFFAVFPFLLVWLVARGLEAFGDTRFFYAHMGPLAGFALSCAVLWVILERFARLPQVTSSVIAEAFTSYLVIAIAFSQLFWGMNRLIPNAFNQNIPETQSSTYLYFSMVTLSGLGYGGIIPINPYVRLVAAFENMIGIFYLAVVVARLVSSVGGRRSQ